MPPAWQTALRGLVVVVLYGFSLWRIVRTNRGNKVIECGVISLVLMFAAGFLAQSHSPDWLLESTGMLLLLMCFVTLGLFLRESYRAIRNRFSKQS